MKAVAAVSTSSAFFSLSRQIRIVVGKVGHQTVELAGQASKALSKINGISAQILFDRWICKTTETISISSATVKAKTGTSDHFVTGNDSGINKVRCTALRSGLCGW